LTFAVVAITFIIAASFVANASFALVPSTIAVASYFLALAAPS